MFWHFDHRFGTYEDVQNRSDTHLPHLTLEQYSDPAFVLQPWYWVDRSTVIARLAPEPRWVLAFRDITNATNERTAVFALLPWAAVGHTAPLMFTERAIVAKACGLVGNLNSLLFDFVVRQKMGGTHLTYFILRQLPVLFPDRYTPDLLDFIVPRVVELTYTAWDLQPFAQDILDEVGEETWARWFADASVHQVPGTSEVPGTSDTFPPPFVWDEERRAHLRAELDALYAHLYGLTRDELSYILDTFPIVRRKDEARWGEYRTKRLVLEAFESLKR
jgi:hypothetical protein